MKDSQGSVAVAAITLVVGLAVGGGIGFATANNSDMDTPSNNEMSSMSPADIVVSPAADTRVALNNALREHVSLAGETLRAAFDGSENTDELLDTLDENSVEVAAIVGSVYGDEAEGQFLELWRSHIGFFADYTAAAKAGDQAAMDQALADLAGYGEEASTFFANANPNLPKEAVKPLLVEHRDLVIDAVNAYGSGDVAGSFAAEQEARDQVGEIANALAGGIVAQYPEKF